MDPYTAYMLQQDLEARARRRRFWRGVWRWFWIGVVIFGIVLVVNVLSATAH